MFLSTFPPVTFIDKFMVSSGGLIFTTMLLLIAQQAGIYWRFSYPGFSYLAMLLHAHYLVGDGTSKPAGSGLQFIAKRPSFLLSINRLPVQFQPRPSAKFN